MDGIRRARIEEAADLEALQRRSSDVWAEYRDQLAAHPEAIEVPIDAIRDGRVRVAVDAEDRPLGFSVVLAPAAGACELDGLFVEPERMSVGVGRRLGADAAAGARTAGARRIDVTANPRAVGFYERVGFRPGDAVRTRFGPAVRMHLDLTD